MNALEELCAALEYANTAIDWYYNDGPGTGSNSDDYNTVNVCCKRQTKSEDDLPFHLRTRECTEDEAWAAKDRWMNDRVSPDIEPGKPFITYDPDTNHTIVMYKEEVDGDIIYERYNDAKEY